MIRQGSYKDYNVLITYDTADEYIRIYHKDHYEKVDGINIIEGYATIHTAPIWETEEVIWYE